MASTNTDPDILVNPADSPCSKIRLRLWEADKWILDVYLSPDGKHKFMLGKAFPKLIKGDDYRAVSECLDLKKGGFSNSGGLNFVYDGRTLIFNFNSSGYAISRGGVR
ncbi:hypothetical protein [Deinococcus rubellus]|uniref:Uncharacterized protein n=1 Tax=Deinococcus rubellus TaxID=1889240 RepID=A0ABY5YCM9_9DEIO|nr:hypothetical protein [Deinococcus rubellus]UWX62819.1 hypothetical protein N0D28_08535 [Deinococcus rubellus]